MLVSEPVRSTERSRRLAVFFLRIGPIFVLHRIGCWCEMGPKRSLVDARVRARRRRSRWRILAVPILGFACTIGVFLVCISLALQAQNFFGSDSAFYCTPTRPAAIVLSMSLFLVSIAIGFLIANLLLRTILPIRAALEQAEARAGQSFTTVNAALIRYAVLFAIVGLPICAVAASSRVCLSDSQIFYRPHAFAILQSYSLSKVVELRPQCFRGVRGAWDIGLEVAMADGISLDLATIRPWFSRSSPRILAVLWGMRSDYSQIESACPTGLTKLISP